MPTSAHRLTCCLAACSALALLLAASGPASAQDRGEVREVLNRAETQDKRRAVEGLLARIGVTTRANAQTLPPAPANQDPAVRQPPFGPVAAARTGAGVQVAQGTPPVRTARATPAIAPAATRPGSEGVSIGLGTPGTVASLPRSGTPANPTMIARVPNAASGVEVGTEASPLPSATVAATAGGEGPAGPAPVLARAPADGAAVAAVHGAVKSPMVYGRSQTVLYPGPEWCPPGRI